MYNNYFPPPLFGKKQFKKSTYKDSINCNSFQSQSSIKMNNKKNTNICSNPNFIDEYSDSEKVKQSESLFEIFGINIYFDDLLIICILFFLYKEGIQDEYLFIALILLLLN